VEGRACGIGFIAPKRLASGQEFADLGARETMLSVAVAYEQMAKRGEELVGILDSPLAASFLPLGGLFASSDNCGAMNRGAAPLSRLD
jgi:hypothetical protein